MQDYSEKRDFIRMTVACDMQIRDRDSGHTETVRLEDLSATGMRFFTEHELAEGCALDATITPHSDITPPMQAEIRVLRCQESDSRLDIAATIAQIKPANYPEAVTA